MASTWIRVGLGGHVLISALSLNCYLFESTDEDIKARVPISVGKLKMYSRMLSEIYRGQNRASQVRQKYTDDCKFDTPLVSLVGNYEVSKYLSLLPSLKPVQLSHVEHQCSEHSAKLLIATQCSVFGYPVVLPLVIDFHVDNNGLVDSHKESWNTKSVDFPIWTYPSRRLNGLVIAGVVTIRDLVFGHSK